MAKKKYPVAIVIVFCIAVVLSVLDYLNLGFVASLNPTYTALIWGNTIVILIFLFSFWKIDARNIEVMDNRRKSALHIMKQAHISAALALSRHFFRPLSLKQVKNCLKIIL